ncbi:enoyl-CoA hydratase-related protein [Acidimicrobiia bacterium EGI L10123]|uniref:enoyl-CoA hydratase-related protein n=1 Tax=Salinilacustrithrix flava TaxID=2957203 RepID=UPI003D7C1F78|nr:enoyl-CoA hydratase-related protein [Acidimicrobiia bacterium EGI L10123]
MELKAIRYEVADRVARLTLDRAHRGNAWTGRMHLEYRWAMTEAEADPEVRVVVVTGAENPDGRTAFCVGADAKALEGHVDKGGYDDGLRGSEPPMPDVDAPFAADFAFQLGMRTPVVAVVNGAAAGVGLVIACFADIRFGVQGAKLTTAAPKLGFPAEYGLSWLLPRLVGAGRAADWLLSGRIFLTDEAAEAGLLSAALPADDLGPHVERYVTDLARHVSPASVAATKAQLWGDLLHDDPAASVRHSMALLREMSTGPDFVEGARALSERRPPEF